MKNTTGIGWMVSAGILLLLRGALAIAGANEIQAIEVSHGTIALLGSPSRGCVYRQANGKEEKFAEKPPVSGAKETSSVVPGLSEVGFKLDNGTEYFYKTDAGFRSELDMARQAARDHPGNKLASRLFESAGKNRLEIPLEGWTAVFRVEITIHGETQTIWIPKKEK